MLMEKIESKTQEVVLLLTVVAALALVLFSGIYLSLPKGDLSPLTGNVGLKALGFLFSMLGHSTFYLVLMVLHIGLFLAKNWVAPGDITRLYKRLSGKLLLELAILFLIAASLTVFQSYLAQMGALEAKVQIGGLIGFYLGGFLYSQVGLVGSVITLFSAVMISLILLGRIQLVALFYGVIHLVKRAKVMSLNGIDWVALKFQSMVIKAIDLLPEEKMDYVDFIRQMAEKSHNDLRDPFEVTKEVTMEFSQSLPELPDFDDEQMETEETVKVDAKKKSIKKSTRKEKPTNDLTAETDEDEKSASGKGQSQIKSYKKRYAKPSGEILESSASSSKSSKEELQTMCDDLRDRLVSFGIEGEVLKAHVGARLVMYEFQPAPGVRLSKVTALTNDLALMLGAESIRILAPIPGKTTVGIEVPRETPDMVKMGDMLKPLNKAAKSMNLPIVIGKDIENQAVIEDISKMPHMLVSGTTGSGKSVFINNLVVSLLYTQSPKNLRMIMIDPKMIELSPYNGIPHLLKPVVTDLNDAKDQLVWAQDEMDRRYQVFSEVGARDLNSFNETVNQKTKNQIEARVGKTIDWAWETLPQIVIIVDELADLMITQGKEVEVPITRIAQKARAAGIHLILATQRPSAEVVTGLIKTNFPTRVAFKVSSSIDSRTILDSTGAEKLLGNGDMLFMANGKSTIRYQSPFISEKEVKTLVDEIS